MKFCILCIGSHGDIRPYVALGSGLKAKGHDVWIASHKKALPLCQKYDLNFKLVDGDLTELINSENTQKELKGSIVLKILKIMRAFKEVLNIQLPTSLKAVLGADVLIYSPAAFAAPHLAEFLNIPSILIHLQPEISTKFHASHLFPNQKFLRRAGHFISEQILWQPIRKHINQWRARDLNIKKMHFLGPKHDVKTRNTPTLVTFSRHLIPPPKDWGKHVQMTNFCCLKEGKNWKAPPHLDRFLESYPSTIYLGFGSLTEACHKSTVKKIIDVLSQKKCPIVVQANLPGLNQIALPSHILPIEYAPHDWLFPRIKAVIHHGGIGTTAAGLYAGKPTLIMPFVWDQFFWGKMIADLNIGPKQLPINQFNSEAFSEKIDHLLTYPDYEKNALKMMHQLNSEPDGIDITIEQIMNIVELYGSK